MEVVRQVIDSSLLDKIPLPQSLKNRRVEIIIRPLEEGEKAEAVSTVSDEELLIASEFLMEQNREAYEVLAKFI